MINTLIFDFGDVFINLDKVGAMQKALKTFNLKNLTEEFILTNNKYEQGLISTVEFLEFYKKSFPNLTKKEIISLWNYIIKDFPVNRFHFIKKLAQEKKYKLILLSNTNELHINYIKNTVPFYNAFKDCFDAFYLSHEIKLRKPNVSIFTYVLSKNNLKPQQCLFIDDTKENTNTALQLGFNVWNNNPKKEDVINLFTINKTLFN